MIETHSSLYARRMVREINRRLRRKKNSVFACTQLGAERVLGVKYAEFKSAPFLKTKVLDNRELSIKAWHFIDPKGTRIEVSRV